jgi:hypothetical protein
LLAFFIPFLFFFLSPLPLPLNPDLHTTAAYINRTFYKTLLGTCFTCMQLRCWNYGWAALVLLLLPECSCN